MRAPGQADASTGLLNFQRDHIRMMSTARSNCRGLRSRRITAPATSLRMGRPPPFWYRLCCADGMGLTCTKRRRPLMTCGGGDRTGIRHARHLSAAVTPCCRRLTAMPRRTRTSGTATATWREPLATRDISRGPTRCRDRAGLGCGPCGTEPPPNAKSYNESAVPELPGPVDRLVAAPFCGSTGFLVTVRQQPSQDVGAVRPERQC